MLNKSDVEWLVEIFTSTIKLPMNRSQDASKARGVSPSSTSSHAYIDRETGDGGRGEVRKFCGKRRRLPGTLPRDNNLSLWRRESSSYFFPVLDAPVLFLYRACDDDDGDNAQYRPIEEIPQASSVHTSLLRFCSLGFEYFPRRGREATTALFHRRRLA